MTSSRRASSNRIPAIGLCWSGPVPRARVLVTIDTDFGELVFVDRVLHAGLVRLPDVPVRERIALMREMIRRHRPELEAGSVITIRSGRIRITHPPLQ